MFGPRSTRSFPGTRQLCVPRRRGRDIETVGNRFANAIVIRLELLGVRPFVRADQAAGNQGTELVAHVAAEAGGCRGDRRRGRLRTECNRGQQVLRPSGRAPFPDHGVEPCWPADHQRVVDQLVDENELPRDSCAISEQRSSGISGLSASSRRARSCACSGVSLDLKRPHIATRSVVQQPLAERTHEGRVTVFGTVCQEKQDWWRVRQPQHFLQQRRAVEVALLQIVDREHERRPVRDTNEQLAQRGSGLTSQLEGIQGRHDAALCPCDFRHVQQHRKESRSAARHVATGERPRCQAVAAGHSPGHPPVHRRPCMGPTHARGTARQ